MDLGRIQMEGICSEEEYIPFVLDEDDTGVDEQITVDIRHVTYSDVIRDNLDPKFKIHGKFKYNEDVFAAAKQLFFDLNFFEEDSVDEYGLNLYVCLKEHERDINQKPFQSCNDCPEDEYHRSEYNCDGDVESILDIVFEFKEQKDKISQYWDNALGDKRVIGMKKANDIDKIQLKMLEELNDFNPRRFHMNINYFSDAIYVCPYKIIQPWMVRSYHILADCLDSNMNVHQWPRGMGIMKEWHKTVQVFSILRNKIIEIHNIKSKTPPKSTKIKR